ncbi:Zinc finger CCCH domain-containing protein 3 [Dichanthelium oligosanthes]|uniref:Zinc finger CCCH domain-containing protein 3 n=1 Tax=Dichanthelium oligosanthes TaxID=888268 RepID=A0A1E5UQJ8_9POAL|nr:Zinc finger CCCH domain-containing protein 3 [Dichanthelium oligosanthes]
MPLGKYYCDYCDKQFQDTPAARKRHLQGTQHQRARALWYDSVRHQDQHGGASSLLLPDGTLAKGVCHHFVRTAALDFDANPFMLQGTCKYGDSCRYFHPKPGGANPSLAAPGKGLGQKFDIGNVSFLCHVFTGNVLGAHTSWGNLPPSLQPPPEGGYPPLPLVDWG